MTEASIPVNLFNPGQVFGCLGFLEAADALLGDAEGGFDWSDESDVRFRLRAKSDDNPFGVVLGFLANSEIRRYAPASYADPVKKEKKGKPATAGKNQRPTKSSSGDPAVENAAAPSDTFPGPAADPMTLPIRLVAPLNGRSLSIDVSHWADASTRNDFKLYSGNRSAATIARAMLSATRGKKKSVAGGLTTLWLQKRAELEAKPFDILTPVGGSFNFDPRGAWTGIDAGYSPNDQGHDVAASPVVEILAAIGLQNARPDEYDTRRVRYAAWGLLLPPVLSRAALGAARLAMPARVFTFMLALSGKNKVVTFAQEEISP